MPCEVLRVGLKPVNFFAGNPAGDVVPSWQGRNQSVLVDGEGKEEKEVEVEGQGGRNTHMQGLGGVGVEAVVGHQGEVCCTTTRSKL